MNTIAVDGLSSVNACIGRVNLFTSTLGDKWLHCLRMIRYCIDVSGIHERLQRYDRHTAR